MKVVDDISNTIYKIIEENKTFNQQLPLGTNSIYTSHYSLNNELNKTLRHRKLPPLMTGELFRNAMCRCSSR